MKNTAYNISVPCPWCGLGETLADKPAEVNISCCCHICGRFYNVDLENKRAEKAAPLPKARSPCRRKKYIQ